MANVVVSCVVQRLCLILSSLRLRKLWMRKKINDGLTGSQRYAKRHPERFKQVQLKSNLRKMLRRVNISEEYYEILVSKQAGLCAVCRKPETAKLKKTGHVRRLAIDHDHETGAVRGLLCTNCNTALGLLKDDLLVIETLVNYLKGKQ